MKKEEFIEVFGDIDEKFVTESARNQRRKFPVRYILAAAVVVAIMFSMSCMIAVGGFINTDIKYKDTDVPTEKTLKLYSDIHSDSMVKLGNNGDVIEYCESRVTVIDTISGKTHYYADSEGNSYFYDNDGNLLGFECKPEYRDYLNCNAEGDVTEEKAAEITKEYAYALFGDIADEFELTESNWTEQGYSVSFSKKYGFTNGPTITGTVEKDGSVLRMHIRRDYYNTFKDITADDLNGVTEEDVWKYVDEKVEEKFGEYLTSYERMGDLWLYKLKDKEIDKETGMRIFEEKDMKGSEEEKLYICATVLIYFPDNYESVESIYFPIN